ncbi:hypothetical protein E2C01_061653 [Portunus trituberculatus]|uniref:Uncharacterized protein n=1 Tax=Portunus trituberculatus TaxID=210409 RepID=A0A5B7HBU2_PORTR|nr:hypothetical protein [Portunus trituberculatus]
MVVSHCFRHRVRWVRVDVMWKTVCMGVRVGGDARHSGSKNNIAESRETSLRWLGAWGLEAGAGGDRV